MHREPAVRDSSFNRRAIFLVAASGTDDCVLATDSRPA
jgi:hypothetical protein